MNLLGTDRAGLYARREGLDSAEARQFGRALCRRCAGTPLQHLTGEQQFLDLSLAVRPGVFIPRPETEGLVETALDTLDGTPAPLVVDVGTGTGAVALAIAARRPDARVMATDLSKAAVSLARRNAARLGLDVAVWSGDLLTPVPIELHAQLSLLVSNPPYLDQADYDSLPREVRADPYEALVGGTEFHRRLAEEAPVWLAPGGWLVLEIGDDQGDRVRDLLAARLTEVEVLPDLAGRDRVVRGRLPA
jgi:release factor glutamine methyltransferase